MPSLLKSSFLGESGSLSWKTGTAAEWSSHNPRGDGHQPATPLRQTQVCGARWDPSKGTEGADENAQQATIHHLAAAPANQGRLSWLESANVTCICMRGWKDLGNYRIVSVTLVLGKVSEQLILSASRCRITRDWAQPAWVDHPDLLWPCDPLSEEGKALVCVICTSAKSLTPFSQHSSGETSCSWLGQVHCSLGKNLVGGLISESGDERCCVQLLVSHKGFQRA